MCVMIAFFHAGMGFSRQFAFPAGEAPTLPCKLQADFAGRDKGPKMPKTLTDKVTFRHGATLSSRIVQPPMLTNSGLDDGFVTQDTIDYYSRRSQSAGMVIVEYCYVSFAGGPSRSWADNRLQLGVHTDAHIPGLRKIARVLKRDGNKALIQLAHCGRESNWRAKQGHKVYAPSSFDFGFLDYEVEELSNEGIEEIISDFGKAARRAIDCGFDGIEIHGANHYLLQQFFSAWSNRRNDHWGGDAERRMNFILAVVREVLDVVRRYAKPDFIVGYRLSPEEVHGNSTGYDHKDALGLVRRLTETFELDYIHLSLKNYNSRPEGASLTYGELFQEQLAEGTKLIIVGNVTSEAEAQDALKYTDLVAVGRQTLIDPEFGGKISRGRGSEIIGAITPEQVMASKLTPGLIAVFSDPENPLPIAGCESIYHLHSGESLDKSVLKDGTGADYGRHEVAASS